MVEYLREWSDAPHDHELHSLWVVIAGSTFRQCQFCGAFRVGVPRTPDGRV